MTHRRKLITYTVSQSVSHWRARPSISPASNTLLPLLDIYSITHGEITSPVVLYFDFDLVLWKCLSRIRYLFFFIYPSCLYLIQ